MNLSQFDGTSEMGMKIGSAYDPTLSTPSVKCSAASMYGIGSLVIYNGLTADTSSRTNSKASERLSPLRTLQKTRECRTKMDRNKDYIYAR